MRGAPADPLLQVEGLTFSYPTRHVFESWSVAFGRGATSLQGPNGSGKSTLLKLLAGALSPSRGRRAVLGIDADRHPLEYRRHVFWCGPGPLPFDHLLAREYLGFLRGLYPRFDHGQVPGHIDGFGLSAFMASPLRELSTGSQRKLAITAALAVGTPVVLLDEPLSGLDEPSLRYAVSALRMAWTAPTQAWVIASHEPLSENEHRLRRISVP